MTTITDADWPAFWAGALAENARRETIRTAREQAEQAAKEYAAAVKASKPRTVEDVPTTGAIGPGEHVIVGGVEWVNHSGAWLSPHTAGPGAYPWGWTRFTPVDDRTDDGAPAWDGNGHAYKQGELVQYKGVTYRVIAAHTSQATWTPDVVASLYARM